MARAPNAAKVVQEELTQARQMMALYSTRIEALEDILDTLNGIDAPVSTAGRRGARKTSPSKAAAVQPAAPAARGIRSKKLPPTGKDFWLGLLTETPQPATQVFKTALSTLRIRPTPEDRKKLMQRMSNALSILARDSEISAQGERRSRRYSKKHSGSYRA